MNTMKHGTQAQTKETGQGFVEYAIILILVGIAVVAVVAIMQPAIGDVFSRFVAQAPVAPPSLLNYTPPPTFTPTPTTDPNNPPPPDTPTATATSTPTATSTATATSTPTATSTVGSPTPCPYGPPQLPAGGSIRVQMEDFRCGGAGVAFLEIASSGGSGSGVYRSDVGAEGPDLAGTTDAGGGYYLGWVGDGEWIEYEVNAVQAAAYDFVIRNASPTTSSPRVRITVSNGFLQYNSGIISLGSTNGWDDWTNDTVNQVELYPGVNIVRFTMLTGQAYYNYFDIRPAVATATPTAVIPTATATSPPPVTLTLYSNAGHDGHVRERNNTNQGQGNQVNNFSDYIIVGDNDDNNNEQYKGFVSFDTSAIPANATITSVQLRLQQQGSVLGDPFGSLGNLYADIAQSSGFSGSYTLEAEDFQAAASVNNVITLNGTPGNNQWFTGTLGATYFNLVNRSGYTQFRIHFQFPDDGDRSDDQVFFDSSDAGPNNQPPAPELIITYTVP